MWRTRKELLHINSSCFSSTALFTAVVCFLEEKEEIVFRTPRNEEENAVPFWENQASLTVLQWVLRATIVYIWLLLLTKLMGQREIGRLNAFDFVILITFGSTAAGVLNNSELSLRGTVVSVGTLSLLNVILAYLAFKSPRFRRIVQDEPIVVVQNGRVIKEALTRTRFNLDDLLLGLRQKNYPNLHDVEFAILESNGMLSVIPKSQARPVTARDLQLPTAYEGMPAVLIENSRVMEENLRKNGLERTWLERQLHASAGEPGKVFVAMLDTRGRLFVSGKDERYIH